MDLNTERDDELHITKVSARRTRVDDAAKADRKIATWLILPVVICLSQRLSHACLSINKVIL
jgi:hypothetical protein